MAGFDELRWFRFSAVLRNERLVSGRVEHPYVIFESVVKRISKRCEGFDGDVIFHFGNCNHSVRMRQGIVFEIEFLIFGVDLSCW